MSFESSFNLESLEKTDLSLGFIPLTDCAPLVVASEKGYFTKYGLNVSLSKETSWANIRDKVAIGILDGAQMLAPMPLAMSMGLGPIHKPMISAFSMDLNGNAITVSNDLYQRMSHADAAAMARRSTSVHALKAVIEARKSSGQKPLTFAVVYPFSAHNYELRYWLGSAGIDPDKDVRLVVVPPPQMVSQLEEGLIDGYCVGEPWNSLAMEKGLGHTLITKYEIWNNSPEKVLGVSEEWAAQHPNTHMALLMALLEASMWVDQPENRKEVAAIISRSVYVNAPEHVVRMSMTGTYQYSSSKLAENQPDFNVFHRYAANYPWRSHAVWFITQMIRWGQVDSTFDMQAVASQVYRPDLYRAAAKALGLPCPNVDYKSEGTHDSNWKLDGITLGSDSFFDDQSFIPEDPVSYLTQFDMSNMSISKEKLMQANVLAPAGKSGQINAADTMI